MPLNLLDFNDSLSKKKNCAKEAWFLFVGPLLSSWAARNPVIQASFNFPKGKLDAIANSTNWFCVNDYRFAGWCRSSFDFG